MTTTKTSAPLTQAQLTTIKSIEELGFDHNSARLAVIEANGNLDTTIRILAERSKGKAEEKKTVTIFKSGNDSATSAPQPRRSSRSS